VSRSKLTISWDELNSPQVDERIGRREAAAREAAEATTPAVPASKPLEKSKRRGLQALWYNTIVFMSVFGLLGGLLGWAFGEVLHFRPDAKAEARELISAQNRIRAARQSYHLTEEESQAADRQLRRIGRDNPYFAVLADASLSDDERAARLADVEGRDARKDFFASVLFYSISGTMIAMCLAMADSVVVRNWSAALVSGSTGAGLGLVGGIVVSLIVDPLYSLLIGSIASADDVHLGRQMLARGVSWGVLGMFLMIAPGLLMRNMKSMWIGLVGGLVGGIVGGVLLDPIARLTDNEHVARLIAIGAIGLVAGLTSGVVESAAKTGWLKVTAGWIAGKQFVLYRNPTYIGNSLQCSIYLFKDAQVGRRHAAIHIVPGGFEIEDLPLGGPTAVNGKRVARARLRGGDRIQIGSTTFLFQEKTAA
jgi:hypothetical protein